MIINSLSNKKIKEIIKLKDTKNVKKLKKYFVDGLHLVEEALCAGVVLEIFVEEGKFFSFKNLSSDIPVTYITKNIVSKISEVENSQGVFALCEVTYKEYDIESFNNIIILDKVQDPGNLGTIIRTADAFSYDLVVLGKGCVSLYNQKVLRSMQGSNFHIPCLENIDIEKFLDEMENFTVYATSLLTDSYMEEMDIKKEKRAIIFGNEAKGVSENILKKVDKHLKIKMPGKAESLNVSISSAIVMHYFKMF